MNLVLTTPIMGDRPGFDPGVILGRLDSPDAKDAAFLVALVKWCTIAGVDPAVASAMWLVETDNGRSVRWNRDLNASGMGIVADATAQPFRIPNVDASARLFVQCLCSLVTRKRHPGINLWVSTQTTRGGDEWFTEVWLPKVQSSAMPDVRTVADLGTRYVENGSSRATWSWEDGKAPQDTYGKKLVSRLAVFYPLLPDRIDPVVTAPSTEPDPIPAEQEPTMANPIDLIRDLLVDAPVTKQWEGQGYNTGPRAIAGLVEHETQGDASGEWYQGFFSCPNGERCSDALVDWLIDKAGKIYQFQDPFTTTRIPWASGGTIVSSSAIGRAVNAKYGGVYGGVNAVYAAVEIVKTRGAAMTAAQIESTARLLAYVLARCGYPADGWKYPAKLGGNVPTSCNHSDLYASTNCRINDDDRKRFEDRATVLLREFYGGSGAETYARANPVSKGSKAINGHVFLAPGGKTVQIAHAPLNWADEQVGEPTGPELAVGTKITQAQISHYVQGTDGNIWVVLTGVPGVRDGSRFPAAALVGDAQ